MTALSLRQAVCDAEGLRQTGCPRKMTLLVSVGREGIGQRETLSCGVASRKASADPPGSSRADLSQVGRGGQTTKGTLDQVVLSQALPDENGQ